MIDRMPRARMPEGALLIFAVLGFLLLLAGLVWLGVSATNADERAKCVSLQKQGVKVYIAEGLTSAECVVLQRNLVDGD